MFFLIFLLARNSKFVPNDSLYENFTSIPFVKGKILANQGSFPTVKYLFELGPLKDCNQVYSRISFFSEGYSASLFFIEPTELKLENYDYLIFSHYDKNNSVYLRTIESGLFILISSKGPSLVFQRKI